MRTNRPIRVLLVLSMVANVVLAGPTRIAAESPTPTLSLIAPGGSQPLGGSVDVQVSASNVSNLGAFEFDFSYDRTLVQVVSMTVTSLLGNTAGCNPSTARCGLALGPLDETTVTSVGAVSYGTGAGATGSGVLAVLHLQSTGSAGTTSLHIGNPLVTDIGAAPIAVVTQDATLTFGVATPTRTPTATSTATRTPTASATGSSTRTPTASATGSSTRTPTASATGGATRTPTITATPIRTPTATLVTPTSPPTQTLYLPLVVRISTAADQLISTATSPAPSATASPTENQGAGPTLSASPTQGSGETAGHGTRPIRSPKGVSGGKNTDLNGDGFTNDLDVQLVAAAWGTTSGGPGWNPAFDFDGNGVIDLADIQYIAGAWRVPNLVSVNPGSSSVGKLVILDGSNFAPAAGGNPTVTLNKQGGGTLPGPVMGYKPGVITMTVPTGAATGPLTVTVLGQNVNSVAPLTIKASSSFTLTAAPGTVNVIKGQSGSVAVSLASTDGFAQLAALSLSGLPAGVSATFTPHLIAAGHTSVLSLTVPSNQAVGDNVVSIAAVASVGGITVTQSTTMTLSVQPVTTSFVGRTVVDDDLRTAIAGVTIAMMGVDGSGHTTGCTGQAVSDAAGNFALTNLPATCGGGQLIRYDGTTATSPAGQYAGVDLFYMLTLDQVTAAPVLIHLPRIDNKETVMVQQNAPADQIFTFATIPGLTVTVYAGTLFTLFDGTQPNPFPLIAVQVPVDRLPDTMPPMPNVVVPFIVAFQPANATASQPVAVSFPNVLNTPLGTNMELTTLDPTKGIMVNYGTGTVSTNGAQIVPDADPAHPGHRYGLVHFDWHAPQPTPSPTPTPCPAGCCCTSPGGASGGPGGSGGPPGAGQGKPVSASSGIEVMTDVDIAINGARGKVSMVRTYRTLTTEAGPFGIGTNHNYGYRLDTTSPESSQLINLVFPDGARAPFARQANGTLINTTSPSLRGAIMTTPIGQAFLVWKGGTTYHFTGSLLDFITDSNGNTITLTHDPSRPVRITTIADPVGRQLTLSYDSADRITTITDPIGRIVQYSYNAQGTLASMTNPEGGVTQYTYDAQNRLLTVTDPRGVTIAANTYDANGRVIEQLQADGGVLKFAYTLLNPIAPTSSVLQTIVTDPMGNQTTYRFNPEGFLTDVTDPLGQTRVYGLQEGTNLLLSVTGTGVCKTCGTPAGGDQFYTYDANGNLLTQTDALGDTTTYTYDPVFDKVTSIADPLGHTITFTYDDHGNLLTKTDANGHTTTVTYDQFGLLATVTDPLNGRTTSARDRFGNLVAITDALGYTTSFLYDAVSRQVEKTDALGRRSQNSYDNLDRVVSQTDPLGGTTIVSYDPVGDPLSVTDDRNNTTTFNYDVRKRLASRTTQLGQTETYSYDLNDNMITFVDRRGQASQYTYDALNRRTDEVYTDGSSVAYTYDAYSRLAQADDSAGGVFDYTYDVAGRTTTAAGPFGTVDYTRDVLGRVATRQVVGQGQVTYAYDPAGNLLTAGLPGASVTYAYDALNRPLTLARSNGVTTTSAYDPLSRILSVTHVKGATTLNSQTYAYDAVGNKTSYGGDITQPLITQPITNTFDDVNQLLSSTSLTGTTSYTYDGNGNRLTSIGPDGTSTYTWDARNRLVAIVSTGGVTTTFGYDFGRNLIALTSTGPSFSTTENFVLDDLGNMVYMGKSDGEQSSILTGRRIDQHLAVVHSNGQVEFNTTDVANSTVTTVDESGVIASQFYYEPYGQTTVTGNSYLFQYSGRVPVSGNIYYYRARYYDAALGRFLSEDPIGFRGGDPNLYRYVRDNPVNYNDPTGNVCCPTTAQCTSICGSLSVPGLASCVVICSITWILGPMGFGACWTLCTFTGSVTIGLCWLLCVTCTP